MKKPVITLGKVIICTFLFALLLYFLGLIIPSCTVVCISTGSVLLALVAFMCLFY